MTGTPKYPKVAGFKLIELIGGGGFSVVFRAVNFEDHRVAACKLVSLSPEASEKDRKIVDKEMRVHSALKHINVLEFINASVVEPGHGHRYVPGIYMLLEFAAGGDLFDKIVPDEGVGEEVAHIYFGQLVDGMNYIHGQGVCHRDLKPENLLLDAAGTLKISDFGLSAVFKLKDSGKTRSLTERCGSLPYVAPELNTDQPYRAEPIDVWGVGVILFTLLAGNTPWDEPTKRSLEYSQYLSGEIFHQNPWNRLGETVTSLICGLLAVDPRERMTLEDAYQHPWCIRPSQLAQQGPQALAEKLAEPLRRNGDLGYAEPTNMNDIGAMDTDEDEIMLSATHQSQFTQSLLLFSQTQSGRRYTPQLTRFYASINPELLAPLLVEAFQELGVKWKPAPQEYESTKSGMIRIRVGGQDKRKEKFKGWVELEPFDREGTKGTFCLLKRDDGNPISWKQLWRALIEWPAVGPYVLRKP